MPEEKMNKINVSVERQRSLKPELALIIYSEGPNMYGHEREGDHSIHGNGQWEIYQSQGPGHAQYAGHFQQRR